MKQKRAAPTPVRFAPEDVELIQKAADAAGMSRNRLIVMAAKRFALDTLTGGAKATPVNGDVRSDLGVKSDAVAAEFTAKFESDSGSHQPRSGSEGALSNARRHAA